MRVLSEDRTGDTSYGTARVTNPLSGVAASLVVVHPVNAMDRPVQVSLDPEQRRRARRRAAEAGLTLSDYISGLVDADLESWVPQPGAPAIIPISTDAPPDHEGTYIGEAVAVRMNKPPDPLP